MGIMICVILTSTFSTNPPAEAKAKSGKPIWSAEYKKTSSLTISRSLSSLKWLDECSMQCD